MSQPIIGKQRCVNCRKLAQLVLCQRCSFQRMLFLAREFILALVPLGGNKYTVGKTNSKVGFLCHENSTEEKLIQSKHFTP